MALSTQLNSQKGSPVQRVLRVGSWLASDTWSVAGVIRWQAARPVNPAMPKVPASCSNKMKSSS